MVVCSSRRKRCAFYPKIVRVNEELFNLYESRIINKENKTEPHFIIESFRKPDEARALYNERLQLAYVLKAL